MPDLQDRLWCLEHCPEEQAGSCALWACNGAGRTCTIAGSLDGACAVDDTCNAAGDCVWNQATCQGLTCPAHPRPAFHLARCNAQGHCGYEPANDPQCGSDALAAEIYVAPGV